MGVAFKEGHEVTIRDAKLARVTMYQLADMRDALETVVGEQGGELTPEQEQAWDAIGAAFEDKVQNTALLMRERRAAAETVKAEAKRLSDMAAALDADADRLESLLLNRMQAFGKTEVKGTYVKVAVQANNPSVVAMVPMDDETLRNLARVAPFAVRRIPESFALDKKAILEQVRVAGLHPDLARYVGIERKPGLRVR